MHNRQVNVCLFVDYAFMMRKSVKSRFSVIRTHSALVNADASESHLACRKVNYHIVYTTAAEPQPFGCRPYMLGIFRKDIQIRRFLATAHNIKNFIKLIICQDSQNRVENLLLHNLIRIPINRFFDYILF